MKMTLPEQRLKKNKILYIEIFTRTSPRCNFCEDAKVWLRNNLPEVKVIEYSIDNNSRHLGKWSEFLLSHPTAKSVPQIMVTMNNTSRYHVGSLSELKQAFQTETTESA